MIQISQISFRDIILKDVVFSDGEDLMKLLKDLGKENIDIQDEELKHTVRFEERQDACDEEEKVITIEDIKNKFELSELSHNSKIKYLGAINRIITWFDYEVDDLFENHTDEIISQINEKYPNVNTRKQYISSILNIYKFYDLTELYGKVYNIFNETKNEIIEKKETKPIEIAVEIMDDLQLKYQELKEKIIDSEYNEDRIYCAIASLFINHGVLRGSELINMFISKDDKCQIPNFIDLENHKMIINDHKTSKSQGIRTINLCDDFIDLLKDFPNRYFVTNEKFELYKDSSGLSKKMKKYLGFKNYTMRKAKSSINLKSIDQDVCEAQGHNLQTQMSNYREYA